MPATTWTDPIGRTFHSSARLPYVVRFFGALTCRERHFGSLERARAGARQASYAYSIFFEVADGVGRFIEGSH